VLGDLASSRSGPWWCCAADGRASATCCGARRPHGVTAVLSNPPLALRMNEAGRGGQQRMRRSCHRLGINTIIEGYRVERRRMNCRVGSCRCHAELRIVSGLTGVQWICAETIDAAGSAGVGGCLSL
jgi:hypothetical protein